MPTLPTQDFDEVRWRAGALSTMRLACIAALCFHAGIAGAATTPGGVTARAPLKIWQYEVVLQSLADPVTETQNTALRWLGTNGRPDLVTRVPHDLLNELGARLSRSGRPEEVVGTLDAIASLGGAGSSYLPEVASLLKDGNSGVRAAAARAIGAMGESGAAMASEVAPLLMDTYSGVRDAAVQALEAMDGRGAEAVAPLLKDGDPRVRIAAAQILGASGAAGARFASAIVALLEDSSPKVRAAAVQVLGHMGEASVSFAGAVAALLEDRNRAVRIAAARVLGALGEAGAGFAPEVAALLDDKDPYVRADALLALRDMGKGSGTVAPKVAALLNDTDADVRDNAVQALAAMGESGDRFAPEVAALLKDEAWGVREEAVHALGGMGPSSARFAHDMVSLLKDANPDVQGTAALSLRTTGKAGAAEAVALLKDGDPEVRSYAANALGNMGEAGAEVAPELLALLKDRDPNVVIEAGEALDEMGEGAAAVAPQLAKLLNYRDSNVRGIAAHDLGKMSKAATRFAPELAERLKDEDPSVRALAARDLGLMGASGARFASEVAVLLTDWEMDVRGEALVALGEMGEAGARFAPAVAALVKDETSRSAALEALAAMNAAGAKGAFELAALLKSGDPDVRVVSAKALGEMGPAGARFAPEISALLKDGDPVVRVAAVKAFGEMGAAGVRFAPEMSVLLKDSDPAVRVAAVEALTGKGKVAASYAPGIAALLKDEAPTVRHAAQEALRNLSFQFGPIGTPALLVTCLEASLLNRDDASEFRLTCHLLGPLSEQEGTLMEWVSGRDAGDFPDPKALRREGAIRIFKSFDTLWPDINAIDPRTKKAENLTLRRDVATVIEQIGTAQAARLRPEDIPSIEVWIGRLDAAGFEGEAAALRNVLDKIQYYVWARRIVVIVMGHAGLWILLVWAYPRCRPVQSFFFWNRWGRKFLGLGYVGFAITYIPWLRQRMFVPFRPSLVHASALNEFDALSYFPDSEVVATIQSGRQRDRQSLSALLSDWAGQIVLEGQSGLGKSTALVRLAVTSRRVPVLLRATETSAGVVEAIQARLQGRVSDEAYLRDLIHMGAIDVLIDGLNETTPETRERIVDFAARSFRGNVVMTTQPMRWEPPGTARVWTLQPLQPEQIERFLVLQWQALHEVATVDEVTYMRSVAEYVARVAAEDDADAGLQVLGNPLEASIVAELLCRGERPDLLRLIEQRVEGMESDFRERENRQFPYARFAEEIYAWQLFGETYFDATGFDSEVSALAQHKLMIKRVDTVTVPGPDAGEETVQATRWWFRHERFMEYFLLPAFMADNGERRRRHADDEAFFGVYELLALKLSDDEDCELRDFLVERAADTKRHDLEQRYIIARRRRRVASGSFGGGGVPSVGNP